MQVPALLPATRLAPPLRLLTFRRFLVMVTSQPRPFVPGGTGTLSDTSASVCVQE